VALANINVINIPNVWADLGNCLLLEKGQDFCLQILGISASRQTIDSIIGSFDMVDLV
jgi:hypothetical protein